MNLDTATLVANLDQTDRLNNLLRWAHGTISIVTCDADLNSDYLQNAALKLALR